MTDRIEPGISSGINSDECIASLSVVANGPMYSAIDPSNFITLQGDITVNTCGTITVNPEYAADTCIYYIIEKYFADRSYGFRESLKNIFRPKSTDQRIACLTNMFTTQSLEFFQDMSEEEILRFVSVTSS